ncbi:VOC family protein [Bacillus swezeyi]|uniref:Glyoxalase/fosfomycin resistance/dioxygenase domain-containing protein n=1 Tax=Bacillus swezeyi TaxID=1925020 RepID=A0A1R1RM50_9BACI|nr:VOC family protein [Bacillus swezeyi]MEC1259864.1 VOC family protein [Bacillus swezeyi]MED2930022.1 VOC family protein [Bacillus swezeyi]MED2944915.1 VOC family protein [Bacillus swezeyi]MED2963087.1 VOC family protein [Bacillus swezeyi]MED3074295.1 VOC family protein [Bacillus swezeyi]
MEMPFTPYILMNGRAKEAIEYYREVLDAEVKFQQTLGEGPKDEAANFKEEELDLVAHAVLTIGGATLMIADIIPELPFQSGNQISICITADDAQSAKQLFDKLREQGEVNLELKETYFSPAYGIVTDPYGVAFQIFAARN